MPGQRLAEPIPLFVVVWMDYEMVHLGIEDRRFHCQGERGPGAGRADCPQFAIEFRPVAGPVAGVDPVVFAEKEPDRPRSKLADLPDVRLDHRVALQAALAERERGHVPRPIRLPIIHPEADRFRGGEYGGQDQKWNKSSHGGATSVPHDLPDAGDCPLAELRMRFVGHSS